MNNNDIAIRFEDVFLRLFAREEITSFERELADCFEFIAARLLGDFPSRNGHYFDGAVGLTATVKTQRIVDLKGEMWAGRGRDQWTEPFQATVADKRITQPGFWIVVRVGADRAEGELMSICGVRKEAKPGATPNGDLSRRLGNSGVSEGTPP